MTEDAPIPYVDFPAQFTTHAREIMAAVEGVFLRGDYVMGSEVPRFEEAFARLCGARFAVGVANGTDALVLTLRALGVGTGDEVVTAPNSFIASAASIALTGAKPVFVDVGADMLMDPQEVRKAVTPRTKAIMPVHLTGRCADMDAIRAAAPGLPLVEDAAQSVGALYKGRPSGSLGAAGCFSLHPLKNLNAAGDAGIITTDDEALAGKLRLLRNHGLKSREESAFWGYNSRLDTLQAAVLNTRLPRLKDVIARRRALADRYRAGLSRWVDCPVEPSDGLHTYHVFVIQSERRDALKDYLASRGVDTRIHYPIPLHLQEAAGSLGHKAGDFPACERQAKRILSLPIHDSLTDAQADRVIRAVSDFHTQRRTP